MSRDLILNDFARDHPPVSIESLGGGASKYCRAAIVAVFELNGGIIAFADWAKNNPTDYYTKLFGKIVTREPADTSPQDNSVERLLHQLDLEATDVTPLPRPLSANSSSNPLKPAGEGRGADAHPRNRSIFRDLAKAAKNYAASENQDG